MSRSTRTLQFPVAVAIVALALIYSAFLVVDFVNGPVGFDSAYNLFVSKNLAEGRGYISYAFFDGDREVLFDPRVTTGPTMLLPLAVPFAVADGAVAILGARIIAMVGYLFAVWGTVRLGHRIAGTSGAIASALVPLFLIGQINSTGILGEVWAAALLVWAAVFMPHRYRLSAFLIGLAVVTKVVTFLAVPAFGLWLLFLVWCEKRWNWQALILRGLEFSGIVLAPTFVWEAIRFAILGPVAYIANLTALFGFARHASARHSGDIVHNALKFMGLSELPTLLNLGLVLLLAVVVVILIVRVVRERRGGLSASLNVQLAVFAAVQFSVWSAWWIVSNGGFLRHVVPGLFLSLSILVAALVRVARDARELRGMPFVSWVPLAIILCVSLVPLPGKLLEQIRPSGLAFGEQVAIAGEIEQVSGRIVTVNSRSANADLEIISGRHFEIVTPSEIQPRDVLVVTNSPLGREPFGAARLEALEELIDRHCGRIVVTTETHTVCQVSENAEESN